MYLLLTVIVIILTTIVCIPLVKTYRKKKHISKHIDILPGEKYYPIVGTIIDSLRCPREDNWNIISNRHVKHGPILRAWLGSIPVVYVYKAEHVAKILKSHTNLHKGTFYGFLTPWLGEGLISANGGPEWKHHRKVITPAFHFKSLENYGKVFAEKSELFSDYIEQFLGKGYFEVTQYLHRLAVDIISETAMGVQLDYLHNVQSKYGDAIDSFVQGAYGRMYNPAIHNNFIYGLTSAGKKNQKSLEYIKQFNRKVIEQRRNYLAGSDLKIEQEDEFGRKAKMCFLDVLLTQQENSNFSIKEIEDEVNTFMFAGQDTTLGTITWSLMVLGNYPEILKKVQEELDHVLEGDHTRKITIQDVAKMEYLDRVVKEVLRCYCVIPFIARELLEDIEIDGLNIPQGVSVLMSLYDLHHDPTHYPDPWKFDPDRFLPENCVNRHPFAFIPFSAGVRNCLGQKFAMQNAKTILAAILRRYDVKCKLRPEEIKYYFQVILKPQNGLQISIEPRQTH